MTNATNVVETTGKKEIYMKQMPKTLYNGMKLIDTYKDPSIFTTYMEADIDKNGILSDGEVELFDKKQELKEDADRIYKSKCRFDIKDAVCFGGILSLTSIGIAYESARKLLKTGGAVTSRFTSIPYLNYAVSIGAIFCAGYMLYKKLQTDNEYANNINIAKEQIKKLEEEYRTKHISQKAAESV